MNLVLLIGRVVKEPEVKLTPQNLAVCSFTLAVEKDFKDASGNKQVDFINCVAWRKTAEIIGKHFHKGMKVSITGALNVRNYDNKEGHKVYVTEVVVDKFEFCEKLVYDNNAKMETEPETTPSFFTAPENDTSLPFDL